MLNYQRVISPFYPHPCLKVIHRFHCHQPPSKNVGHVRMNIKLDMWLIYEEKTSSKDVDPLLPRNQLWINEDKCSTVLTRLPF